MNLAGKPLSYTDGTPLPLTKEEEAKSKMEHVTIEFWGLAIPESRYGKYGDEDPSPDNNGQWPTATGNNTYKAIRVIGESYNLYYSVWCTNEKEFYDLKVSTIDLSPFGLWPC